MDTEQKNKKYVVITRLVIILTILWEIFLFVRLQQIYIGMFDIPASQLFLILNIPVVIIIGLMWIFGIFRLKALLIVSRYFYRLLEIIFYFIRYPVCLLKDSISNVVLYRFKVIYNY